MLKLYQVSFQEHFGAILKKKPDDIVNTTVPMFYKLDIFFF